MAKIKYNHEKAKAKIQRLCEKYDLIDLPLEEYDSKKQRILKRVWRIENNIERKFGEIYPLYDMDGSYFVAGE